MKVKLTRITTVTEIFIWEQDKHELFSLDPPAIAGKTQTKQTKFVLETEPSND